MSALAPWQQRAYQRAIDAIDSGRMAHALLICGPERLGKRAVAERLARRVLCRTPDARGEPCSTCRSCQLLDSGTHPDLSNVSFVMNKEGTRLRSEILIEQVRELSAKLALTPQYGNGQIAIVAPADAMNHASCNALLKTLEEPQPARLLWLVSAHPARLPATVRSRCQRLELRLPPRAEALAWLRAAGHAETLAADALDAGRGHPGLADTWLRDGGLDVRSGVVDDLSRLSRGASAVETAHRWAADEHGSLRLGFAADHALALASGLTDPLRTRTLATWFDAANRTRALLRTPIRADLAMAELLLAWQSASQARTRRTG